MISRQETAGSATTLANGFASGTSSNSLLREEEEWRKNSNFRRYFSIRERSKVELSGKCAVDRYALGEVNKSPWYISPWRHYHTFPPCHLFPDDLTAEDSRESKRWLMALLAAEPLTHCFKKKKKNGADKYRIRIFGDIFR
ncbi:hypothetical protein CDAR_482601 [Caerostris darwini]|uniref:Uncharacterized protein n=1 Tax=Caerostris darwini TaxID=1538125 RepID=A0AAV4Q1W3_9ARAC|nr:hypothetical protein CDAR_482601 [Caerostris darwini]